ncbi:unnamed protein product, partial [Musa textilis]
MMWVEQSMARVGVPYPHFFKQDGERRGARRGDLWPCPVPAVHVPRPPLPSLAKSPM